MTRNPWRWFPRGLILSMLTVFAVNVWFVYLAMQSFPGIAGADGFDLSNNYDHVLQAEARQATLGWQVNVAVDAGHHAVLGLRNRAGAPLQGAAIDARAERPVGPEEVTKLDFHAVGGDLYRTNATLLPGQWDVLLTMHAGGDLYSTTRRVIIR